MNSSEPPVDERIAPSFESVETAIRETTRDGRELGAACAVSHRGKLVVDLWGGHRDSDRTQLRTADTLVVGLLVIGGII